MLLPDPWVSDDDAIWRDTGLYDGDGVAKTRVQSSSCPRHGPSRDLSLG